MTFSGSPTFYARIPFSKMTDFLGLSLLDKLFATNIIGFVDESAFSLDIGCAYSFLRIFASIPGSFYSSFLNDSIVTGY